jgi:predicted lactoylglutathione lyase
MNDKASNSENGSEIMFSLSAKSKDEVDNWADNVQKEEAQLLKKQADMKTDFITVFLLTLTVISSMHFSLKRVCS